MSTQYINRAVGTAEETDDSVNRPGTKESTPPGKGSQTIRLRTQMSY